MSLIPPQYPTHLEINTDSETLKGDITTADERTADDQDESLYDYPLTRQAYSSSSFEPADLELDEREEAVDIGTVLQEERIKKYSRATPEGISYTLLKYPLLAIILVILWIELIAYVLVRQYVNVHEQFFHWRGARRRLRAAMRQAKTYEEWLQAAEEMDRHMNLDQWRHTPESAHFDYRLIRRITRLMSTYRKDMEPKHLLKRNSTVSSSDSEQQQYKIRHGALNKLRRVLLDGGVKSNLGGIENVLLYSRTYVGTKISIDEYVKEVMACLEAVYQTDLMTDAEKAKFFKKCDRMYGRSALCLSGGACLGYYHLGVLKALIDHNLIPRVVTGTSAGSLMAAIVCVRTDDEIRRDLTPLMYDWFTACEEPSSKKILRLLKTGAAFDPENWISKMRVATLGDMTFLEAYEKTGRILNITAIPTEEHSPAKLLNYKNSPDVVIWSAILCSSAVPFVLPPMELRRKQSDGRVVLYHEEGEYWRDGSLRIDVPIVALHQQFHVNHTIVSQVNPHVTLFFFDNKGSGGRPTAHRGGRGWRGGFIASYLEHTLKLDLVKWLRTIRDLSLLPSTSSTNALQSITSMFLQKFDGSITILPKSTLNDYVHILSDPTLERMQGFFERGQRNAFPKLAMIRNRMTIELALYRYRQKYSIPQDA